MARVKLGTPITINPAQATDIDPRSYTIVVGGDVIVARFDYVNAAGEVLESKDMRLTKPQAVAFLNARVPQLKDLLLAELNATEAP
jgi:hypothetical protein